MWIKAQSEKNLLPALSDHSIVVNDASMKIAFYAPLKSPNHPNPSGDRQMARALIKALEHAGHQVWVASQLRSFSKTPHSKSVIQDAKQEAASIVEKWAGNAPDLWFSYHPYYKAPDFLFPEIRKIYDIAVVTAESSLATKRDNDAWSESQKSVRQILQLSHANFYFTDRDRPGLESEVASDKLVYLAPFIDQEITPPNLRKVSSPTKIVTMGMMRGGVKLDSYAMLAKSLEQIQHLDWHLTIIGDGSFRPEVENLFSAFDARKIHWAGQVAPKDVSLLLSQGDIFAWPGFNEAYGLAYLEAQAVGLPVVAQNTHGVPSVVKNNETGVLTEAGNVDAFRSALVELIENVEIRETMGANAEKFVRNERGLTAASHTLNKHIERIFV